jgi:hypothetical protein
MGKGKSMASVVIDGQTAPIWHDALSALRADPPFEKFVLEQLFHSVSIGLVDARTAAILAEEVFAEATTTLSEVIANLRLTLSNEDERKVRDELGLVIGRGSQIFSDTKKRNPDGLKVAEVRATLAWIAEELKAMAKGTSLSRKRLEAIEKVLHGAQTGFRDRRDTEVAVRVIGALGREIGRDRARERVIEFQKWPRTVAKACRRAATELDEIKGAPDREVASHRARFHR